MKAHIFTEKSNTTCEDCNQPIKKYYEGLFGMVTGLHDELAEFTEANLRVVSEEYGVANDEEKMSDVYITEKNLLELTRWPSRREPTSLTLRPTQM